MTLFAIFWYPEGHAGVMWRRENDAIYNALASWASRWGDETTRNGAIYITLASWGSRWGDVETRKCRYLQYSGVLGVTLPDSKALICWPWPATADQNQTKASQGQLMASHDQAKQCQL